MYNAQTTNKHTKHQTNHHSSFLWSIAHCSSSSLAVISHTLERRSAALIPYIGMMIQSKARCTILAFLITMVAIASSDSENDDSPSPIKVFLLAGQSNMVGRASITHLHTLIEQDDPTEFHQELWNGTSFRTRCDVYMQYLENRGCLTMPGYAAINRFGPEIGLGWTLGDYFAAQNNSNITTTTINDNNSSPIILIKTAWGGKDLAVDFRPPLSGEANYSSKYQPTEYGQSYRQMIMDFQGALSDLSRIYPHYDPNVGFELAGFIWFQGWNDMIYEPFALEYAFNLANFIRNVRIALDAEHLPFVVGELGMHGLTPTGRGRDRVLQFRASQLNVTLLPEFVNNTAYVPTSPFVPSNDTNTTYGSRCHYFGRADTYYHIGKAFGQAAIKLMLDTRNTSRTLTVPKNV
jgi:hypothetical protein